MSKQRMGSSLDDFLEQEGDFDETQAQAIKEVVAWQLAAAIVGRRVTIASLCRSVGRSGSIEDEAFRVRVVRIGSRDKVYR